MQGEPCFVTFNLVKKEPRIIPIIEESTRDIRPPSAEEYPYTPYEFADEEELRDYFRRAIEITIDELYKTAKNTTKLYVDQDKKITIILAA